MNEKLRGLGSTRTFGGLSTEIIEPEIADRLLDELADLSERLSAKPEVKQALQGFWDEAQKVSSELEDDPSPPKRVKPRKHTRGLSR